MAELIGDNDGMVNVPRDHGHNAGDGRGGEGAEPRRSARTVTRRDYSEVKRRVAPQAATKKRKAKDAPVVYMDGTGRGEGDSRSRRRSRWAQRR